MRTSVWLLLAAACGHTADRGGRPPANAGAPTGDAAAPTGGAGTATSDADCALDRAAIQGALRHGDRGTKTLAAPTFSEADRHVTEAIEIADGTRISFSLGGCAHYGWQLTYELGASAVGTDAEHRLDAAEALLRRTPMGEPLAVDMADRIKNRSRTTARPATGPWSIECGDANCDVDAVVDGAVLRISVSYDFPM